MSTFAQKTEGLTKIIKDMKILAIICAVLAAAGIIWSCADQNQIHQWIAASMAVAGIVGGAFSAYRTIIPKP